MQTGKVAVLAGEESWMKVSQYVENQVFVTIFQILFISMNY